MHRHTQTHTHTHYNASIAALSVNTAGAIAPLLVSFRDLRAVQ